MRFGVAMVWTWNAGNYLNIVGNWYVFVLFGWRFVFGIIVKMARVREPFRCRCHHDSGVN